MKTGGRKKNTPNYYCLNHLRSTHWPQAVVVVDGWTSSIDVVSRRTELIRMKIVMVLATRRCCWVSESNGFKKSLECGILLDRCYFSSLLFFFREEFPEAQSRRSRMPSGRAVICATIACDVVMCVQHVASSSSNRPVRILLILLSYPERSNRCFWSETVGQALAEKKGDSSRRFTPVEWSDRVPQEISTNKLRNKFYLSRLRTLDTRSKLNSPLKL